MLCATGGLLLLAAAGRWGSEPTAALSGAPVVPQTTVVIATRDLEAGSILAAGDLRLAAVPDGAWAVGTLRRLEPAIGGRLLVGLAAGAPIPRAAVGPPQLGTDSRLVRVSLQQGDLAPDIVAGSRAELDSAVDAGGTQRLTAVAVVDVLAVSAPAPDSGAAQAGVAAPRGAASDPASARVSVLLRCATADTLRVLWSTHWSKGITLVALPAGAPATPGQTVGAP